MEKQNGINYENGLPTSTNGSWIQTVAYLLDLINKNQCKTSSGDTATVSIIQSILLAPQQHIEVYNPHPITTPSPNIQIKQCYITPSPKVTKVTNKSLYWKCCGSDYVQNAKKPNCLKKVDECYQYIKEKQGYVKQSDITASSIYKPNCGCKK